MSRRLPNPEGRDRPDLTFTPAGSAAGIGMVVLATVAVIAVAAAITAVLLLLR